MKKLLFAALVVCMAMGCQSLKHPILPVSSTQPSKTQQKQIERKYGMFIHFGINTFQDEEWTDGSKPASSYIPTSIDADQWIKTAKDAGMKYVILITKHHGGFCLLDSKYSDYDVANSGNQTNVVEAVAKACRKYGILFAMGQKGQCQRKRYDTGCCIQQLHDSTTKGIDGHNA